MVSHENKSWGHKNSDIYDISNLFPAYSYIQKVMKKVLG